MRRRLARAPEAGQVLNDQRAVGKESDPESKPIEHVDDADAGHGDL
jgi:hypothetical protein